MAGDGSGIEARAARANGGGIAETVGPVRIIAADLAGSAHGLEWSTTLFAAREIQSRQTETSVGLIILPQEHGRMVIEVTPHHGWRFYVEVDADINPADRPLRWDSLMSTSGPVNGIATRDPQTGLWYFTTPVGHDTLTGIITVDSMVEPRSPGANMFVRSVDILAFR